jgi:hypothetical protein
MDLSLWPPACGGLLRQPLSLEAHFYSASFGAIFLLSAALLALAVAVALAARRGTPALMGQAQSHTNLLLALSIIWIYVEATTLIIIWGADLPHEVEFYLRRLRPPWDGWPPSGWWGASSSPSSTS